MSKSITVYLAANGCFAQDGDSVYLAVGDNALGTVTKAIQEAQAGADFTLEITKMELPALDEGQLQVVRIASGWKLFTQTEAFVYSQADFVLEKVFELAKARFGDYAPGIDYILSIPIESIEA